MRERMFFLMTGTGRNSLAYWRIITTVTVFLFTLYVLMDSHYHLILETHQGNLLKALCQMSRPDTFNLLDFEGVLTVVEPGLFIDALNIGIGSAKAFGCGLMMVKRIWVYKWSFDYVRFFARPG